MKALIQAAAKIGSRVQLGGHDLLFDQPTIEIESEKTQAPAPRIGRLAIRIHVPAGLDERHIAGIERTVRRCPAYGTRVHTPSIEMAIERSPESNDERKSA